MLSSHDENLELKMIPNNFLLAIPHVKVKFEMTKYVYWVAFEILEHTQCILNFHCSFQATFDSMYIKNVIFDAISQSFRSNDGVSKFSFVLLSREQKN